MEDDNISLLDVVLIGVPEAIITYLLGNSFVENKLEIQKIMKISLIYGICCYFIKNMVKDGYSTVIIFILCTLLYYLESKVRLINCFILFSLTCGVKFISEFIVITIASSKGITIEAILGNEILNIMFYYTTLIIPIIILMINSKMKLHIINLQSKKRIKSRQNRTFINILIVLGAINIVIVTAMGVGLNLKKENIFGDEYIVFMLIMIGSVFCVTALIIIVLSLDKSKEIALIEKNLMASNLNQMQETVDLLRIQRHDVMNHLQVILMQINNGKSEDARRYILGLADDVKHIGQVFDTGNNYIDAILNFKNRKCMDSQIELTACIDNLLEGTKLDDTQLSSIFLNIIDNAIDELKKSKKEYKYIHVDTYCQSDKHIISIKNNGSKIDDTEKIFKMGVSSKGNNRGYGLFSIKQLLLKYKCSIEVVSDEDETEFIIQIPIYNKDIEMLTDT